jgi:hypothetical protein
MGLLRDRLDIVHGGPARLRSVGTPVAEAVARPAECGSPADLIAALAYHALGDDESAGPALIRNKPRDPSMLPALAERAWAAIFPGVPHRSRLTLAAGLLQMHDFWDASHDAAQQADDLGERECSPYWHGIAHRREPDAGNASYWFRRVGKHPNFKALAEEAGPILDRHGDPTLSARLISGGTWNPSAMIDLCTTAKPGTPTEATLRRLQRIEMWLLLEATFAAL